MIKDIIRKLRLQYCRRKYILYDTLKYIKYSTDIKNNRNKVKYLEREIAYYSHVIEKGLSHNKIKPLFGYENVINLKDCLNDYIKLDDINQFFVDLAISSIKEYNRINMMMGVEEDKLIEMPGNIAYNEISVGAYNVKKEDLYKFEISTFDEFMRTRHSIRLYDCKSCEISLIDIQNCIEKSFLCSPSACNRQPVRVKIVFDRGVIKKICDIQGGSRGFAENAGALLIVTSDLFFYKSHERRMQMFDCGIYTSNLINYLHANKIGTCILHGSLVKKQEMFLKEIINIPENEMIAAFVLCSSIPENANIKVTYSPKRMCGDIWTVLQ